MSRQDDYWLNHNPKGIATFWCDTCGDMVRQDRLEFHKCK